ncbi:MAG: J domain-containing protein [Alphaproteobacteria bacterium]|nr:J domain-containing protein [Alphaproteobacteria bacterium]
MNQVQAYPLTWPETMPRSPKQEKGLFKTTLAGAIKNVQDSLTRFGKDAGKPVTSIVISSNVSLGVSRPDDPGVAAWFVWEGNQICIPVDRYSTVEANLQAIHHILEARRTELRHGTLNLVRATFQGFKALPAPPGSHWTEVLGLGPSATAEDVDRAYKILAKGAHPDQGGSDAKMSRLNSARANALKQIGAS